MSLENCTGYPEMPKDSSECVKLLRQFNEWRRFDGEIDEEGPAMPHPKSIGFAIDMAIRLIEERGELLAALEHFATWGRGQHRAIRLIEELADMTEQVECSTIVKENMEGRLNILLVKYAAMKEQRDELLVALDSIANESTRNLGSARIIARAAIASAKELK